MSAPDLATNFAPVSLRFPIVPAPVSAPQQQSGSSITITYDAVGNRLTQETLIGSVPLTTAYLYDVANRLTSVDSVSYTWDNNGNLLNDGVNSYSYNTANQLTAMSGPFGSSTFAYNGLGDRLTQNGVNYTLDLNAGLTQVLGDGTNSYLYGLGRIAEYQGNVSEYYLGDALGSVRQLVNDDGEITLSRAYEPYGDLAQANGSAQTDYGFTGEFTDDSGLVYLRARYYAPEQGRFTTRDTWEGNVNTPASLNRFNYAHSNPVMYTDPSGNCIVPMLCTMLAGGILGASFGAGIGAALAGATYEMAQQGLCGCEGQLIIASYTKSEFVRLGAINGAKFGLVFGLIAGTGNAGATVASLAGLGVSVHSAINAAQRLMADPNNRCALFDLTVAVFFGAVMRNIAIKSANTGLATGQWFAPIKPSTPPTSISSASPLSANLARNEVMLSLNRGNESPLTATFRIPSELVAQGKNAYWFTEWLRVGLSDFDAQNPLYFEKAFSQAMNRANRINFDITELNITRAWREGQNGIQYNKYLGRTTMDNVTNFEFYQIMTHPKWLGKTTFYRWENGIVKWFTVRQNGQFAPTIPP